MRSETIALIQHALSDDPTLTRAERGEILQAVTGKTPFDRILHRKEVAQRLMVTSRTIGNWAAQGLLKRVSLPGRKKALGYRESDVSAFIEKLSVTRDTPAVRERLERFISGRK
jgi:hypothetical protein